MTQQQNLMRGHLLGFTSFLLLVAGGAVGTLLRISSFICNKAMK